MFYRCVSIIFIYIISPTPHYHNIFTLLIYISSFAVYLISLIPTPDFTKLRNFKIYT
jgi:hypothetical protein